MFKHAIHFLRAVAVGAVPLLIAACGGSAPGGSTSQPAAVDTTVVSGTVTGFGSVIIDGVEYPEGSVSVARDVDPRGETATTMAGVKVGQQVEASVDASGKVTKVLVRATVIGAVESVDVAQSSFKVVGQTVRVVTSGEGKTIFEGVDGLAGLNAGDWVEVHGTIDADKNVLATRVEVQPPGGETKVRAGGIVKEANDSAKTFKLGDLTINYAGAVIKPDGATIANDELVFVFSDQLPVGNVLTAKAIRVAKRPALEGRRFVIGGLVSEFNSISDFKVNGLEVDASSAEIKGGGNPTAADIKNMVLVRVEGTLTGTGSSAVLKATRVWIIPASEQRSVLLIGQVTDFVSAASFKVRGTPVDASASTVVFRNGTAADLKEGAFVAIKGHIDGSTVKADQVSFLTPPAGVIFKLFGTVSDYNATAKTFRLLGIPMKLADNATFGGGTLADFGNGKLVEVKGSFDGTAFVVTEVQFKSAAGVLIHAEGALSDVTATSFKLNGATFKITGDTTILNGPLANGQQVDVEATLVAGELVARRVEVQLAGATARLFGTITDFVSKADFKVQGQSVDASSATFVGGTDADLANGKLVRVEGALNAGVVKATLVKFLR
jgi:hypothetical protein